jgi:transcriptional regulator with XRE-family HTH domain
LSANIKKKREVLGISQEKLAELAEVSVQMVNSIEGCRTWVSDKMLEKLALALNVSVFQLLNPFFNENFNNSDDFQWQNSIKQLRQSIDDDVASRFEAFLRMYK